MSNQAYQQTGTIVTRKNHDDLLALYQEAKIKEQHTTAMGQVELLDAKEVKRRMPLLTDAPEGVLSVVVHGLTAATLCPSCWNGRLLIT